MPHKPPPRRDSDRGPRTGLIGLILFALGMAALIASLAARIPA